MVWNYQNVDCGLKNKLVVLFIIGWNDVTESMVAIRSPFCGYNTIKCVELNGKNLSCYSNKLEPVSLRKCPRDHWLANKAHLGATTATSISQSFTYKMAAKINRHRYGARIRHCYPMYNFRHTFVPYGETLTFPAGCLSRRWDQRSPLSPFWLYDLYAYFCRGVRNGRHVIAWW